MTTLKDLIHIPEQINSGDLVLRLVEDVLSPEKTVADYVPTPQLVESFDASLRLIQSALANKKSKAAILHGSFGSGKSHFMAILGLLLQGNPHARSKPELAPLVVKHDPWLQGKKILIVPFNLIGGKNLEQAIFSQYARFMAEHHPESGRPLLSHAEHLIQDAREHLARLGETAFFAELNGSALNDSGWGDLEGLWDLQRFETAAAQSYEDSEYAALVQALSNTFFKAFTRAQESGHAHYLSLDEGLAIISQHAVHAGFDGVVFFLDELILWLAGKAADQKFLAEEVQKLSKLVESQVGNRPVPLISFIARQRDLSELVGDNLPGVEKARFDDMFAYWKGRYETITLADKNLPEIVEKRVLRPRSEGARAEIDRAFETLKSMDKSSLDTLLGRNYHLADFRKVYPFSPALIEALVALSSVLQRERTALFVLYRLLNKAGDQLQLGTVIPMGDIYDIFAEGIEAFSQQMADSFEAGKRLWEHKLRPLLEEKYQVQHQHLDQVNPDVAKAFINDARLAKTLILSALVPEIGPFKNLTPSRLAALNHGTIKSPIPGQEAGLVAHKLNQWAAQVGEIKLSGDHNPVINVKLVGVDTESIIRNAAKYDNPGARQMKIKRLLYQAMGIPDEVADELYDRKTPILWRNTPREVELVFGNVREMASERFLNEGPVWRLLVDYPFDDATHSPSDDYQTVQKMRNLGPQKTLVWLPAFFSTKRQNDLGKLVILDQLLKSEETFRKETPHLTEVDRAAARGLLENQQSALNQALNNALLAAYGVFRDAESKANLDDTIPFEDHFQSLDPGLELRSPAASNLRDAFEGLLDQAMSFQYPDHPKFEMELKRNLLRKIWPDLRKTILSPDQRRVIEDRPMRKVLAGILNPLQLGSMGENALTWNRFWENTLIRGCGGLEGKTVAELRQGLDGHGKRGLPKEVENLILLAVATATHSGFQDGHQTIPPNQTEGLVLDDHWVLVGQQLPDPALWQKAVLHSGILFGWTFAPTPDPAGLNDFHHQIRDELMKKSWAPFGKDLEQAILHVGEDPQTFPRYQTALACTHLMNALEKAEKLDQVRVLAEFQPPTSFEAMARSFTQSLKLGEELRRADWSLLGNAWRLLTSENLETRWDRNHTIQHLKQDELAVALGPFLKMLQEESSRFISKRLEHIQKDTPVEAVPTPQTVKKGVTHHSHVVKGYAPALQELQKHKDKANLKVIFEWDEP
ncbi:MAG: phage resistance protein [Acidobacteria bacterium]|nr:phage resistance protein [Acidobacteriota bacterium]